MKVLEQDIDRTDHSELREEPRYLPDERGLVADPAETPFPKRSRRRRPVSITEVAEQIQPGTVRRGLGDVITVTGQEADSRLFGIVFQLPSERSLTDTRLTPNEDNPAATANGNRKFLTQKAALLGPAHEVG